jgi:hypothetical protein
MSSTNRSEMSSFDHGIGFKWTVGFWLLFTWTLACEPASQSRSAPSPPDQVVCAIPSLAISVKDDLRRALRAAQERRVDDARKAAKDAGIAGHQLHQEVIAASTAKSIDDTVLDSFDAVAQLGIQGSFLFEESSDLSDGLPENTTLAKLGSGLDMATESLGQSRNRMDMLGYGDCWPPASP